MARLIDADEVKRFYNEEFPTLDNGVHWSRNDIIMNLDNIPTVEAIPVEWIEDYTRKNFPLVHGEIVLGFMADMLEEWRKEDADSESKQ